MAVQQNKKSASKRGMHRSHDHLVDSVVISVDATTGERHRRHHVTEDGFYRGKKMIDTKRNIRK